MLIVTIKKMMPALWRRVVLAHCTAVLCLAPIGLSAQLNVDCSRVIGTIKEINGVNQGPLEDGGMVDLSAYFRQLKIPSVRLHDVHWPNPDVVDIHVIFPNPNADPDSEASYDFGTTDQYIHATLATGARIVYRLGESIEHTKVKYHVHPPRDPQRWAKVCRGIVRHYNQGWNRGFHDDIEYWEIWNEPENRPAMWTGSDEEYDRLYLATARLLRQEFPKLKIGGPAVGSVGIWKGEKFSPTPFVAGFLEMCRREALPLDFFSWHIYSNDVAKVVRQARAVREMLDEAGFSKTQSHLNEWNYLPDGDWGPMTPAGQGEKRRIGFERVGGVQGAAFTAAVLLALQDAPVDMANYYTGSTAPWGLFDRFGAPRENYKAFEYFSQLARMPERIELGRQEGIYAVAGRNGSKDQVVLMVAKPVGAGEQLRIGLLHLPWTGGTRCEIQRLAARSSSIRLPRGAAELNQMLAGPEVLLITLRPGD